MKWKNLATRRLTIAWVCGWGAGCGGWWTNQVSEADGGSDTPRIKEVASPEREALGRRSSDLGLDPGVLGPDVALQDAQGEDVSLGRWLKQGWVVLVFYRGGWCPYCNFQVREMARAWPAFRERHATPVLVSVDTPDHAASTKSTWEVPFPVLSDPDLRAHQAYNVVHQADEEEVARLQGFGMDIEASSGRSHHRFAVPAVFVVDEEGRVRWSHVDVDYQTRPSAQQLLTVLDEVQGGRP